MKPDVELNEISVNGPQSVIVANADEKELSKAANDTGTEKRRCSPKAIRVLSGATLCNYVVALQWTAYGLYYVRLTDYYDVSKATAGWPGSLCIAVSCVAGLFLTPAIEKFNARWTSVVCGLMMFAGMVLSAMAPSIWFLALTYGLIAGFGLGGTMICSVVEVQQTFKHHRPFAQGIAFLGYSASNVLSPIIMFNLIETFSWRGAMLIHAAIVAHAMPGGLLFRRMAEIMGAKLKNAKQAEAAKLESESTNGDEPAKSELKISDITTARKSRSALDVIKEMFDFNALKDARLLLYSLAMLVHRACTAVFLINIPSRAVFVGLTFAQGAYLVSSYSVGNMSGRIVVTLVSNVKCINLTLLVGTCMAGAGLSGCFMSMWASFYISMALCYCLGICQGSVNTVMPSVLSDLFGSERIARLQAITNAFGAIPILVMPPLAGYIFAVTQSYIIPYLIFGILEIFGSLFLFAIYLLHRQYLRKSAKSN